MGLILKETLDFPKDSQLNALHNMNLTTTGSKSTIPLKII